MTRLELVHVVVEGHPDRLAGEQGAEVLEEQVEVERARMVEVHLRARGDGEPREVVVVGVELDQCRLFGPNALLDLARDRGLPRRGAAADADENRLARRRHGAAGEPP